MPCWYPGRRGSGDKLGNQIIINVAKRDLGGQLDTLVEYKIISLISCSIILPSVYNYKNETTKFSWCPLMCVPMNGATKYSYSKSSVFSWCPFMSPIIMISGDIKILDSFIL